jgi:hypothetical protein
MSFPRETVEQASQIARMFNLRYTTAKNKAEALFDGEFLHIQYGFDDALKLGKCGTYLHEVKSKAECFSLAGILYVVAKELELEPEMFYALGVRDVEQGQDPLQKGMYDHAFISVRVGKDRFLIDPYFSTFGKIKHFEDKHLMQITTNASGTQITNRSYSYLHKLSEEEYVQMLERNRAPGGGRLALSSSQQIRDNGASITLEFVDNTLTTTRTFKTFANITEPEISEEAYSLQAPVMPNGEAHLEEGIFSHCFARKTAWQRRYYVNTINEFQLPAPAVFAYLSHMEQAARNTGRKKLLRDTRPWKAEKIVEDCGFDKFGNITKENGVDRRAHEHLLEIIISSYNHRQKDLLSEQRVERNALYLKRKLELTTPENPHGRLYTPAEYSVVLEKRLEDMQEKYFSLGRFTKTIYRELIKSGNRKKTTRQMNTMLAQYNQKLKGLDLISDARSVDKEHYYELMDWILFVQENPLGTAQVTEADKLQEYRRSVHATMRLCLAILPPMQVKKYRKGLQRILQESTTA